MKKRIFWLLPVVATLVVLCAVFSVLATDDAPTPTLTIKAKTLSLEESIYIQYAVKAENVGDATVEMLFWDALPESYDVEHKQYRTSVSEAENIGGEDLLVFSYTGIGAKNMTDTIYACAHVKVNGTDYYSQPDKYSVMQYMHNMKDKAELTDLFSAMKEYGAEAQMYFRYRMWDLPTTDHYEITVVNGTLEDGFNHGLYPAGATAVPKADTPQSEDTVFAYWTDKDGNIVESEDGRTYTVTRDDTWTAHYITESVMFNAVGPDSCKIVSYTTADREVTVPTHSPNGLLVVEIAPRAFEYCRNLNSIVIPPSITDFASNAFLNCPIESAVAPVSALGALPKDSLKEVEVNGTGQIEWCGFDSCEQLTVVIGEGITEIFPHAFIGCDLDSLTILNPETVVDSDAFEDGSVRCARVPVGALEKIPTGALESLTVFGGERIGRGAVAFNYTLQTLTIEDGIEVIEDYAFVSCPNLTSVRLPDSIRYVGDTVFYGMATASCTTEGNIVYLGNESNPYLMAFCTAFNGAPVYNVHSDTELLGCHIFEDCTNLTSLTLPDGIRFVGTGAFDSEKLTGTAYGNAVYLGSETNPYLVLLKAESEEITSCTIHENTKWIFDNAFENCTALTEIRIPDGVYGIGKSAFAGSGVTAVSIPPSVFCVGDDAFRNCPLASLSLPESITVLGTTAFDGCPIESATLPLRFFSFISQRDLTDLTFTSGDTIESHTLENCGNLINLSLPDSISRVSTGAFANCPNLQYNVTDNQWYYLGNASNPYLVLVKVALNYTNAQIPQTVRVICDHAFEDCDQLKTLILTANTVFIGEGAFSGCPIEVAEIPGALLHTLPTGNLKDLTLVGTTEPIRPLYAFTQLESLTVPEGFTEIRNEFCCLCENLKDLYLPSTIRSFGHYVLDGCSDLKIHYNGTAEEWAQIEKEYSWNFSASYTLYDCKGNVIE